jgi:1-acyl-sn-glycerol-3-phosphate acyltransferase
VKPLEHFWDSPAEGAGHFPQRFATFFAGLARLFARLLFRFRAYGRSSELLATQKNYIICGNHHSYLDPVFAIIAVRPRPLRFLAKQEFFTNPAIARLASWEGAFPIRRGVADTRAIRRAAAMLRRGELVGIFPEGTRGREGNPSQAHEGIALIAAMARADVLPVRLWGTEKISPPGSRRWHFPRVTLAFGEPLSLDDPRYQGLQKSERYQRFARDCMDAVYSIEPPR